MGAKKIINFLLLKPAFTTRNFTSIALVAVFFTVYYLAGGSITAVPKIESGSTFGSVRPSDNSSERRLAEEQNIFDDIKESQPLRPITTPSNQREREASETGQATTIDDELSDIEQRLNRLPKRAVD